MSTDQSTAITRTGLMLVKAWEGIQQLDTAVLDAIAAHATDAEPDTITPLDPILQQSQNTVQNLTNQIKALRDHVQNKQP